MLRKIRILFALLFFSLITLLFLDFTGVIHHWFGWLARIQLLPALLAFNVGVVSLLIFLTLLFGRIYCSTICPMGIFQDIISWLSARRKHFKHRFKYTPAKQWLRYSVLAVFVLMQLLGLGALASVIAPYSSYGRMTSSLLAPVYRWGNNLLALGAERIDSYAFYEVDVWLKSGVVLGVAILTFIIIAVLAWRKGRIYCNTICPVGTILGLVSRHALFRPVFDLERCNSCTLCAHSCKSQCINIKEHKIDYSRCVACMDCVTNCHRNAISFRWRFSGGDAASKSDGSSALTSGVPSRKVATSHHESKPLSTTAENPSRRKFLTIAGLMAVTGVEARAKRELAILEQRKAPTRHTPLTPPGSLSARNLRHHCTTCQLCISACPNGVLRPSSHLTSLMQPEMHYDRGFCRPECTRCSEVCPAGAIRPITREEKSSTQIGHAVWVRENCLVTSQGIACHSCSDHCPSGAIHLVALDKSNPASLLIPSINENRCIGCGACENLCPARPLSAIYVEGHAEHRTI